MLYNKYPNICILVLILVKNELLKVTNVFEFDIIN